MSQAARASRLLLYKRDGSPPSCAVRMLGQILGLQFDFYDPDLVSLEHRSEKFKQLNPMATVPVLVDGDFVVSDSHAIMQYMIRKYGGEHKETLYPSDVQTRAIVDQCMFFDAGVLFAALKAIAMPIILEGSTGPSARDLEYIEKAYTVLEAYLQKNTYVATNHLTVADLSVGSTATAGQIMFKLDSVKYSRCKEWLEMLHEKPYFKEIMKPGSDILAKMLHVMKKKNMEALTNKD